MIGLERTSFQRTAPAFFLPASIRSRTDEVDSVYIHLIHGALVRWNLLSHSFLASTATYIKHLRCAVAGAFQH